MVTCVTNDCKFMMSLTEIDEMSIQLFDSSGVVGEIATNRGYMDLVTEVQFLMESKADLEAANLLDFFDNGDTRQPDLIARQAMSLVNKIDRQDVKSTLINLAHLLSKAKDTATVV